MERGIYLKFIDLDKLYNEQKTKSMDLKDLDLECSSREEMFKSLEQILRMHFEDDFVNSEPSCECGELVFMANEGLVCPNCETTVERIYDRPLDSQIWMSPPDGVAVLINPIWFKMFEKELSTNSFSPLQYVLNETYRSNQSKKIDTTIKYLDSFIEERSINYFYYNFDDIIDKLLDVRTLTFMSKRLSDKHEKINDLKEIVKQYRHCIFSRNIAYPSRTILVTEQTGRKEFAVKNVGLAIDAAKTLISAYHPIMEISQRKLNSLTVSAISKFADFYEEYVTSVMGTKPGQIRGSVIATRTWKSGRMVIIPLLGEHAPDETTAPYSWTIAAFRLEIVNALLKIGYCPSEIDRIYDLYVANYDEELYNIMQDHIAACPEGGIVSLEFRYPTLAKLSMEACRITKIDPDPDVCALRVSIKRVKGYNGDFDGDNFHVQVAFDVKSKTHFKRFAPHLSIVDTNRPYKINSFMTTHPENVTTTNLFLRHTRGGLRRGEDIK